MKYINKYLLGLAVLFSVYSCQDITDDYDIEIEFDSQILEYTLSSDDYAEIADLADEADSTAADFISSYEHFNDSITAAKYIPLLMAEYYPGLSYGSGVKVTYNYNGEIPEDLSDYVDVTEYELQSSDYSSIDSVVTKLGFYSPSYPPSLYIPDILSTSVATNSGIELIKVNYQYATVDPIIDESANGDYLVFEEVFKTTGSLDNWYTYSVTGDLEWEYNSSYTCAKMSGYDDGTYYENEDWLITKDALNIDDYDNAALSFITMAGYVDESDDYGLIVLYSNDYTGTGDPTSANWTEFSNYTLSSGDSWDEVSSGDVSLSGVSGDFYIAFKFTSPSTSSETWEITEVSVVVPNAGISWVGEDPLAYNAYYEYDTADATWSPAEDILYINKADYVDMGYSYTSFSNSFKATTYIPSILSSKYPTAISGSEYIVVYDYYNSANYTTTELADLYTQTDSGWVSTYSFIEDKTDQFLVLEDGSWTFDPTVTFTMESSDYQIIVDYVAANIGESYLDSYGTAEYYTGASAYYEDFYIKDGKWDADKFDSWEDAVEYAIGTILLPELYPDAETQVDGVDMSYVVIFNAYASSDAYYSMTFQVTKAGPNPEFTLTDGPTAQ